MDEGWLRPRWPVDGRVNALMTTREGGVSTGPFASMNLGAYVGDEPGALAENLRRFQHEIQVRPVLLKQVHGVRVLNLDDRRADAPVEEADASVTTQPGRACAVTVADCLPVLMAAPRGRGVAAAHAGWRGLAGGVVERTLDALCQAAHCSPAEVAVWLGACIGPRRFEVGPDVLQAFGVDPTGPRSERFMPQLSLDGPPRWMADLPALARERLHAAGVREITGGGWCTYEDSSRFFSFRRDRVTGRMAAAVWLSA